ncbi:MAG: alpha/beta hydrolase [Solirubrobacteraceae bacterium]
MLAKALACAFMVLGLAALAAPAAASPSIAGTIIEQSFASAAGQLFYDVYLPPGYSSSSRRYPVIYYLHGLPATPLAYRSFAYVPAAIEQAGLQAIVVAPQGASAADSDPEYLNKGAGKDWDTAIAVQLPEQIDAAYRTITDRTGRAIVGVSAGGYGAMLLGLQHLARFSVIESWSGYFHPTNPQGTAAIPSTAWESAHTFVPSLRRALAVHPALIGFYVGASDGRFRPENVEFARELSHAHVPFRFRMYPGGHQQALWTAQAQSWLTLALHQLGAPQ